MAECGIKVRQNNQQIIEAIQDDESERTGRIQSERHAFDMARNWMENCREAP